VTGGASDGLHERGRAAQQTLLVGAQHAHKRHLRQVEALAQQVAADERVQSAAPQLLEEAQPLERLDA